MSSGRSEPNPRFDMLLVEMGKLSLADLERLQSWLDDQIRARKQQMRPATGQAASEEPAFEATFHVTEEVGVPDILVRIVGSDLLQELVHQHLVDGVCPATKVACPILPVEERKRSHP